MTFEIYHRLTWKGWRWFWRLRARNHRIIAVGGEGFANRRDVYSIVNTLINDLSAAQIEEIK